MWRCQQTKVCVSPLKAVTVSCASSSSSFALSSAVPASYKPAMVFHRACIAQHLQKGTHERCLLFEAKQQCTTAHLQGLDAEEQQQPDGNDVIQRNVASAKHLVSLVQNQTQPHLQRRANR